MCLHGVGVVGKVDRVRDRGGGGVFRIASKIGLGKMFRLSFR